jgi:hypothetical protein
MTGPQLIATMNTVPVFLYLATAVAVPDAVALNVYLYTDLATTRS